MSYVSISTCSSVTLIQIEKILISIDIKARHCALAICSVIVILQCSACWVIIISSFDTLIKMAIIFKATSVFKSFHAEILSLICRPYCFAISIYNFEPAWVGHLNTVWSLTSATWVWSVEQFISFWIPKWKASISLDPENGIAPFALCVCFPLNIDSIWAVSKQDEIAVIL